MSSLLKGLVGGLGVSGGSTSSTTNTSNNTTGAQNNTYSAGQTGLQDAITQLLQGMIPGIASGSLTPNVEAMKNQSANSINQNYAGLQSRLNKTLASRGFGNSGATGDAALQTEIARQGDLAGNESNYAGVQLGQNNNLLSDALAAAFEKLGMNFNQSSTGTSSTNSSGWGISAGAGSPSYFGG